MMRPVVRVLTINPTTQKVSVEYAVLRPSILVGPGIIPEQLVQSRPFIHPLHC